MPTSSPFRNSGRLFSRRLPLAALLLMGLASTPATASAQDNRDRDCRCVDRDGNELDDCSCMRSFGRAFQLAPFTAFSQRARIGVSLTAFDDDDEFAGARLSGVSRGGPAWDAGLRRGDVVTRVGGHSLFEPLDDEAEARVELDGSVPMQRFLSLAQDFEANEPVDIEYLRDGERHTTTVTPEEGSNFALGADLAGIEGRVRDLVGRFDGPGVAPRVWQFDGHDGAPMRLRSGSGALSTGADGRFSACPEVRGRAGASWVAFGGCLGGLQLLELNPGLASYFGVERGVLVSDVHEDSPMGLEPGDVILRIGAREVDSPEAVRRILASYAADEAIDLQVRRRDRTLDVRGRLGVQ